MTCILIVEDEGDIRELLVEFIRDDTGFEIVEATTADAAVQLLELEGLRLIVTDINLPGRLDGIDLALVARESHPEIPVIFMSGRPAMLEKARSLFNPALFFEKPFSLTTLLRDVHRLATLA
jgi:DNA-binding response OmpR family regulator